MKKVTEKILAGKPVRKALAESITRFPDRIFIVVYPNTQTGYIYDKDYEVEGGGCYYSSRDNTSPVDGAFIRLYPDGRLTYLWNGVEKEYNHEWFNIG